MNIEDYGLTIATRIYDYPFYDSRAWVEHIIFNSLSDLPEGSPGSTYFIFRHSERIMGYSFTIAPNPDDGCLIEILDSEYDFTPEREGYFQKTNSLEDIIAKHLKELPNQERFKHLW